MKSSMCPRVNIIQRYGGLRGRVGYLRKPLKRLNDWITYDTRLNCFEKLTHSFLRPPYVNWRHVRQTDVTVKGYWGKNRIRKAFLNASIVLTVGYITLLCRLPIKLISLLHNIKGHCNDVNESYILFFY